VTLARAHMTIQDVVRRWGRFRGGEDMPIVYLAACMQQPTALPSRGIARKHFRGAAALAMYVHSHGGLPHMLCVNAGFDTAVAAVLDATIPRTLPEPRVPLALVGGAATASPAAARW
jgi:hypothetical protein